MAEQPSQPPIESDRREVDHEQFADRMLRYAEMAHQNQVDQTTKTPEGTAFQDGDQLDLHQSRLGAAAHTKTALDSFEQPVDPNVARIRWTKEVGEALEKIRHDAQTQEYWSSAA